ncbi:SDR family NAD(P)-dependent oxidoreductase [Aminicella lysinilytica]|uniref:3-oxoacyl-[acyl-carrier protein] reductase n=1 Tax=Aminicella lysinilytica TaxID=433323 RepID=A0A4R6Q8U1_9FIRM|nr:SDR family oxidoreductase [Aminicella lysinilytica]TDP58555.1 3-oxoacyl-[acyl-carrier protein] reductase [Aminicella lysinilytica]
MSNITVLTSGTSGIGRAIAEKIISEASEGDKLIINYGHNDKAAEEMKESFPENKRSMVDFIKADMSDYDEMLKLAEKIKKKYDHVDWLVLNTGISTYLPFDEYTYELWDKIMRTNVNIPAFLVKELKPMMAENGNILFMGSHAGQAPYSSSIVYGVSKAAVMFMARDLVKVFDEQKVSVNAIAPGFIETRWQDNRSDESRDRINRKIAAHRFGTPEEVAELCYTVLSNDYLNGSIYDVHGGYDYF